MRFGQLTALLAVLVESRIMLALSFDQSGNRSDEFDGLEIVIALAVLLLVSELVRVGRSTSIHWLMWLGFIARFTGLGWAGTGLIALTVAWLAPGLTGQDPLVLLWIAGGLALATSFYAFSIGRTRIIIRRFKISQKQDIQATRTTGGRPDLRITALSDLHLGEFVTASHIRRAVEISNRETPDIVLLLGDYVDDDGSLAEELVAELTVLEAKLGVFAVLGNHDIKCHDSQRLIDELERDSTTTLLRNTSAFIEIVLNGEIGTGEPTKTVQIIGIESPGDWWYEESERFGRDVLGTELSGERANFTIVASHHPEAFGASAEYSVDLVLAGHTHGGQLAVPFAGRLLNVGRLVSRQFWGLYEQGTTSLVISAGIGVGVIPARIGVPPEVTLIEISFD